MRKRTKWSIIATVALALAAVAFLIFLVASDNPEITPLMVRNATRGVIEATAGLIALVWLIWYWMEKRSSTGK